MNKALSICVQGSARVGSHLLFSSLVLEVFSASWTCLLGPSGVGKTTLLRLIAGLETHVEFKGTISTSDKKKLKNRVAYMAQNDLLLPWATVLENVTLGAKLREEKANLDKAGEIIQRVGLDKKTKKKPSNLSGGERQRVALARTLMEDKPLILLDEPFSALDAKTRSEMQDLAVELLAGRTVLLVTHDPGEAARLCNSINIMSSNGITSFEPPDTIAPRSVDDEKMLFVQGALLRRLREED